MTSKVGVRTVIGTLCEYAQRERATPADNNPTTFGDKYALMSAEIARLEGRYTEAMHLYEQAIQSARSNGFVQNEGVAQEVAARFYATLGAQHQ